ncbi:uncharacterized protein [Miscanthus floridulus]|uniref:uncharacterized protein n=1 Tax=Miscanthus floridulus TaxID=154761 RepID=UPI003457CBB1
MARLHHLSLVAMSLLLLLLPVLAAAAAEEPDIRISVQYPTEEEARWLDRWSEKYQAQGAGSGFSVHPATEEESAYLNSIFDNGRKRAASGGHSHDGGGARAGFDGHIEFDDDDHPFGRIVVDTVHSQASSSEPNDDLQ